MLFLTLLTLLNALAHNEGFALKYRIDAGGMPISVFDLMLGLGVIWAIVGRRAAWPTERAHPLMIWVVVLFSLGAVAGIVGALIQNAELRWMMTGMRNFLVLPACAFIGYCLLLTPRSTLRFAQLQDGAGAGTALVILLFFHRHASTSTASTDLNTLRAVAYVATYAGLAAALLLFTIISTVRLMPAWLALGLCGLCFVGQFATLSRSDWLAAAAAVVSIFVLLPSFRPGGNLTAILIGPPLVVVFLWVGLIFASTLVGRDFESKMFQRVESLLPGRGDAVHAKAWDTRLEGIQKELAVWKRSPLVGGGFGATDVLRYRHGEWAGLSYKHNSWTSTLAETGLFGFAAVGCMVFGMIVVGRRLARDGVDRGYVLIGALAVITGTYYFVHGMATQSFNQMRWGIPLAIVCGVALRARAMQLTHLRVLQHESPYGGGATDARADGYDYDDEYGPPHAAPEAAGVYAAEGYY
jgi:hypothetical protein